MPRDNTYLGDAVYAELTEYGDVELTTSDGKNVINRIIMEPAVLRAFETFVRLRREEGRLRK